MQSQTNDNRIQLFKILAAAAWIDGSVQPEERQHLQKVASSQNLEDNPEIQSLLAATEPIPSQQCYQWLEDYLGSHPTEFDYQNLLEAIAGLVYTDDNVDSEEAKLLTRIESLSPTNQQSQPSFDGLLQAIKDFYRQSLRLQ